MTLCLEFRIGLFLRWHRVRFNKASLNVPLLRPGGTAPDVTRFQEDLWSKLMIAPLFNNSVHGDVLMRRDWLDTCLKYITPSEVNNLIDLVRSSRQSGRTGGGCLLYTSDAADE